MTQLLCLAVALGGGLLMTRIVGKLDLPDVTAYLIAGLLLGPFFIGRLGVPGIGFQTYEQVAGYDPFCDVALGFIAFAIGNEFRLSELKEIGGQATTVGILQAVITTAVVDMVLITYHFMKPEAIGLPMAITLGAIAAATAPAATLMVVRQYKADGPVTKILLPVVALDDAVGLVLFSFSYGIAKALESGTADLLKIVFEPVIEIGLSVVFGAFAGWLLTKLETIFHSGRNRNALIVSFVVLTVAVAKAVIEVGGFECGFSSLLVCMMMGSVFCNLSPLSQDLMQRSDSWTSPLLTLFFVLSGASLRLDVLADKSVVIIGLLYIIGRSCGKYIGANISSRLARCPENVVKYLGITLLPQAGVALGMCSIAAQGLSADGGDLIRSITLFGVMVYELVGPTLTKIALTKAGDIKEKPEHIKNRRENMLKELEKNKRSS